MVLGREVERRRLARCRRTSTASSSVNPSGALSCGHVRRLREQRRSSPPRPRRAPARPRFSSADTLRDLVDQPLLLVALGARRSPSTPCSARRAAPRRASMSARRRSSAASNSSTASARLRRASAGAERLGVVADRLDVEHRLRHLHLRRRPWPAAGLGAPAPCWARPRWRPPSMMLCPWKMPPSSTTSVFDVMLPSIRPPRARCALPFTTMLPLKRAGHGDVLRADVGLDLALRRERDVAVGVDLALDLPVDPQAPGRDDVALEARARTDDRDLTVVLSHLASLGRRARPPVSVSRPAPSAAIGSASSSSRLKIIGPPPPRRRRPSPAGSPPPPRGRGCRRSCPP